MSSRKFANPLHVDSASSPVAPSGKDPVVRNRVVENRNYLADNQFTFSIDKLEHLNFMVTSANVPGLNFGEIVYQTPLTDVKIPGDKLIFEPLIVRYKIDERLENFLELQRWIRGLAFATSHLEFDALSKGWGDRVTLDASISIPTNDMAFESVRVHYQNCFPTAMEGFELSAEGGTLEITSTVTFDYTDYHIYVVPEGCDPGDETRVI